MLLTRRVMSSLAFAKEREIGLKAVITASRLCSQVFNHLVSHDTLIKRDSSPVTIADYGSQAIVNSILHQSFPEDAIVGEEDAQELYTNKDMLNSIVHLVQSIHPQGLATHQDVLNAIDLGNHSGGPMGRFWTLDPIDGTKGFLRGEQFAVCLALIVDGIVQVSVMGCPNLPTDMSHPEERGCVFVAVRGQGAFQVSHRKRVLIL